jgi:O-antigen/teichoic acid export membrane protein
MALASRRIAPGPSDRAGETAAQDLLSTPAAGAAAARGGALRTGGYIVGTLVSLVAAALLFRHLGVQDTGRYVTALSLVAIVAALSDLGLTAVGIRELSMRPPEERSPLARDLLGLRITMTLVGSALVIGVAWAAYSPTLAAGVALACLGLLIQVTQDNFALRLMVELRLAWISALELVRQLLATMLTIALVLLGARLLPFLGISTPVGAVTLSATVVFVRGAYSLAPSFSWRRWAKFIRSVLPYTLAVAASALYFRISVLLVSALSDSTQLGYFGASFRIIEVLAVVPTMLVGSALPIFSRAATEDHDRLGYALGRVFEVSLIVGSWVAVSIAVGAPFAIEVVGGPRFEPAASVLAVQGVGLAAMFVTSVWANGLLSLGLYRQILVINLGALTFNALLVGALVPLDGARGAAIGIALAETAAALVQAIAVVRGRPRLYPSLRSLPLVAIAAGIGLVPMALTGIPVVVRLLISTALFFGVISVTRAFPPELLDLIPWISARRSVRKTRQQ